MTTTAFEHRFVEFIPEVLDEGVLYVSVTYTTVLHKCACGCGIEVVTPLSPTFWRMTFDGETISLYPSIGNWNFPCRSHYWVDRSRVRWARLWTDEEIEEARREDDKMRTRYYRDGAPPAWRPDDENKVTDHDPDDGR
jgi:hypothetical protein